MEKILFQDVDFHDCKVHAFGFNSETNSFLLDVDLIKKWIEKEEGNYKIRLCPATFIFENVWDLEMDISMNMDLIIDFIEKENPIKPKNINYLSQDSIEYDWTISFFQGEINFKATYFYIYERGNLIEKSEAFLTIQERNGICLLKEGQSYFIQ